MPAVLLILVVAAGVLGYRFWPKSAPQSQAQAQTPSEPQTPQPIVPDADGSYTVQDGDTLADVFAQAEVPYREIVLLEQASKDVFDLTRVQPGKTVFYTLAPDDAGYRLSEVWYQPDEERIVRASQTVAGWECHVENFTFNIRTNAKKGTVESSLYESAVLAGLPDAVIIDFADQFAWDFDFARDTRSGDSYRVVYEEKWRDNTFVKPGKVLAAEYVNNGTSYKAFYYKAEGEETGAYYNENGEALRKGFLKAPVNFRYISSGFSNARMHPILGYVTSHPGVDYAADYGAPIIAIGDGIVERLGWETGYGNRIHIRHNERYGSQYGHMSAYVKGMKVGDHVSQGQVIGYVGSTGWSTGNHVHFSITEYGKYIDPATVEAPDGKPVPADDMDAYKKVVETLSKQLEQIP